MTLRTLVKTPAVMVAGVVAVAAVAGAGSAVAAKQITSADIKNGTIQTQDLTKNNFARFTSTEKVVTAQTPASSVPAYQGAKVVDVNAANTPLTTIVLDKGTWKIRGVAQFWHIGGAPVNDSADYGTVNVPGLQAGYGTAFTADIPNGGTNAAQTEFSGTIKITQNATPVVITGSFTGGNTGQAGAYVEATQYEYVRLFKGGNPS